MYVSYQFKLKESLDSGKISPDIYRVFQMATNPEMGRGFNFFGKNRDRCMVMAVVSAGPLRILYFYESSCFVFV